MGCWSVGRSSNAGKPCERAPVPNLRHSRLTIGATCRSPPPSERARLGRCNVRTAIVSV